MRQQVAIPVVDSSQVGEARRAAAHVSEQANLDDTHAGRVAIIVTELANNLVRYAQRGIMLFRAALPPTGRGSVEILSIDSGPGFDPTRCFADGYSTGGTPGNGLGAVQRLASSFDIYSIQPSGTVIMACVNNQPKSLPPSQNLQWSCICRPVQGETACGDIWGFSQRNGLTSFMIADGLGHGPEAAAASIAASELFEKNPFIETSAFIESSHQAMMGTRGAAVAIASIDHSAATLHYAGVGNIAGTLFSNAKRQGLPSHNGIVGVRCSRVKSFEYPLPPAGVIIMHSDGIQTRWKLDNYPGLPQRHPAVIAGILFRDYQRERDDLTILVGSWSGGPQ